MDFCMRLPSGNQWRLALSSCLRTSDNHSAHLGADRIKSRGTRSRGDGQPGQTLFSEAKPSRRFRIRRSDRIVSIPPLRKLQKSPLHQHSPTGLFLSGPSVVWFEGWIGLTKRRSRIVDPASQLWEAEAAVRLTFFLLMTSRSALAAAR